MLDKYGNMCYNNYSEGQVIKMLFNKKQEKKVKITWKWIDEQEEIVEITTPRAMIYLNADPCVEVIKVEDL